VNGMGRIREFEKFVGGLEHISQVPDGGCSQEVAKSKHLGPE